MQDMQVMFAGVHTTLARNLGAVILLFYVLIGVSIAILYSMARGDIARRKRVEQALLESEEKFRSISASMNDCLMTIDDSGAITFWNETAQKIFGYTQAEVLGRELHPLLAPSRYLAAYKAAFSRFKENGDGMAIGKTLEMTALRKDGSEFPIELSLASYHSHGRWHAVGTVRDIADRKLAEQEKETLIADLQDALKEVRQLSGLLPICSHCKKIRDDKGYWNQIESYIQQHSEAQFSHSICQECAAKYYPDLGLYED
jgi:PAS domain S-box-containing protein